MQFDILSIFPLMFSSFLGEGIMRRAVEQGKIGVTLHDIRAYATDKHHMTDDRPFGGGEGMVMKAEPLAACLKAAKAGDDRARVVLLSPKGKTFDQAVALEMAELERIILVCGRYEGVDDRFRRHYADFELSIGDYILTGGELAAMVVIDAVTRLQPGVLGCADSAANDTFSRGLLKHPQYTRPRVFEESEVPAVLLSGDHAAIVRYRFLESVRETIRCRPELLRDVCFSKAEMKLLAQEGLADAVERSKRYDD